MATDRGPELVRLAERQLPPLLARFMRAFAADSAVLPLRSATLSSAPAAVASASPTAIDGVPARRGTGIYLLHLHEFPDTDAALHAAYAHVPPGGLLVTTHENHRTIGAAIERAIGAADDFEGARWSPRRLARRHGRAGFITLAYGYLGGLGVRWLAPAMYHVGARSADGPHFLRTAQQDRRAAP